MKNVADFLRMAAKNVLRNRLRSMLTVLAVTIGITAVLLLTAIGESGKLLIQRQLSGVGVDGLMVFSNKSGGLTVADGERILNRIPSVQAVMPFETALGYYNVRGTRAENVVLIGVDPFAETYMSLEFLHGRMFSQRECENNTKICVVGTDFAQKEFHRDNIIGRKIELTINNHADIYTVVGVARSALSEISALLGAQIPPFVYVPYTAVGDRENLNQLAIQLDADADAAETATQIRSLLRRTNINGRSFQVENMHGYVSDFSSVVDVVTLVLAATAAISLIVAGLGIMNSMLAAVSDRKSEIGVMKAIGAGSGQIAALFLFEALLLTLVGSVIGLIAAIAVCLTASAVLQISVFPTFVGIITPLTVTLVIGILSGLFPAVSAASLQPIAAIRSE